MTRGALILAGLFALATPALARGPASGAPRGEAGPVCTFMPPLRYPPILAGERRRLAGSVLVRVEIDGNGRLAASELLRSELPELFIVEALRAARQGRFRPAPGQAPGERRSLILLLRFPGDSAAAGQLAPAAPAPAVLPAPAATSAPPPPASAPSASAAARGALRVLDAGFGRGVENRRLQDRAEVFGEGKRVYFWMEVEGAKVGQVLRHIWIFRGREMQEIELALKAERWATWSYKTFFPDQRGTWLLELRDAEDRVLGSWSCYCE
jgi:TonB family protein